MFWNVKNEMPDECNPYVIGFSPDEFDVDIVGYEQDFGEWRDKNGHKEQQKQVQRLAPGIEAEADQHQKRVFANARADQI